MHVLHSRSSTYLNHVALEFIKVDLGRPLEDLLTLDATLHHLVGDNAPHVVPAQQSLVLYGADDGQVVTPVGQLVGQGGPDVPVALGAHRHVEQDVGSI